MFYMKDIVQIEQVGRSSAVLRIEGVSVYFLVYLSFEKSVLCLIIDEIPKLGNDGERFDSENFKVDVTYQSILYLRQKRGDPDSVELTIASLAVQG